MSKKYKHYKPKNGLVIGRFQCFHRGHEFLVRTALDLCEYVYLYIGSAQASRTFKDPFSYDERKQLISLVFHKEIEEGRLHIMPLSDQGFGNSPSWGQYILDTISKDFGITPDLYITGCEKERSSWFSNKIAPHLDELKLTRRYRISGVDCRNCLRCDEGIKKWTNLVPAELVGAYEMMRGICCEPVEN